MIQIQRKTAEKLPNGSRCGTIRATRAELEALLGPPDTTPSGDGKIGVSWFFFHPSGTRSIVLRDYWWNGPEEWSVGGQHGDAALVEEHLLALILPHLDISIPGLA